MKTTTRELSRDYLSKRSMVVGGAVGMVGTTNGTPAAA